MELVIFGVAALAFMALLSTLILRNFRRTEANHVARQALASQRGWSYSRTAAGKGGRYTVGGQIPGGPPWTLAARQTKSGNNSHAETRWTVDVTHPQGAVAIGPPLPPMPFDLGGMLVQMMLKMFFGDDAAELADLQKVEVGPPEFQARYHVLATNRDLAESFVSGPTLMALDDWADKGRQPPIVLYWKRGLEIRVTRVVDDPDELAAIVDLGVLLHTTVQQ